MPWFKKPIDTQTHRKVKIPEGLWVKCTLCKEIIYRKEFEKNLKICPKCNYHFRIGARERIALTADTNSFEEMDSHLTPNDPLEFKDTVAYMGRIKASEKKSSLKEAVVTGRAAINRQPVVLAIMDFSFMGGSMGSVVGEKIVRAAERSITEKLPLIVFTSSGGARMQEGIYSLMQMAKVSSVIAVLKEELIPYITVLTDPTFGGVSASFAMLGDIIIAEPRSLIGFAGARVIQQTINRQLPEDFQQAEFLLKNGLIDKVVHRRDLKTTLSNIVRILTSNVPDVLR
ncbi:acetyl-CoA carboxylase, carboxyltransferase subunit beta [Candidatus Magnetomonas plexicatena]|uniref:acetyl-CoA carboxylase, carboxyltransferase subunit beta n=1 Tax=Candidatus Magnetomonas plexicatena TaxID=2552947 RepID=UPI001C741181|nr:acetyl-CoA carboxylase carboxyltransferase subunit beta [Nitrospirales bacterium LBB_01]